MAHVEHDSTSPTGLIVVRGNRTQLVLLDWDHAKVASLMGWKPCQCGSTDGTIDCKPCGRTVDAMLVEALAWIEYREGEVFEALEEYLPQPKEDKPTTDGSGSVCEQCGAPADYHSRLILCSKCETESNESHEAISKEEEEAEARADAEGGDRN